MWSAIVSFFNKRVSFEKRPHLHMQEEVLNEPLFQSEMALYESVGATIEKSKLEGFGKFLATRFVGFFEGRVLIEPNSGQVLYGRNYRTINTAFHPYELYDPLAYVAADPIASSLWLNRKYKLDEAIYLRDGWFNLYHFYFDVVPQLLLAQKKLPAGIPVVVPKGFLDSSFVPPVLRSLGLDNFPFVEQQPDQNILIREKLYLLKDYVVNDEVIELIRKMTAPFPVAQCVNVFLSRLPAAKRSLVNNDSVIEHFQSLGVTTTYAENLTYQEQIALFSSANELFGLHGAGLANMVFMPRGARLIEIIPKGYFANNLAIHYKRLAATLGLAYIKVEGDDLNAVGKYVLPISALIPAETKTIN